MRKAKRLAGAETQAAKLYHIFRDERTSEQQVRCVVLARQTGYKLRPMFDQYGNLRAFAYGYTLTEKGKNIEHWDIQTPDFLFYSKKTTIGWDVQTYPNPTGKINLVYYAQPKAWDGAEPRIKREEMLDSKVADTNNYFADPIAIMSAEVIKNMPEKKEAAKMLITNTADGVDKAAKYLTWDSAPQSNCKQPPPTIWLITPVRYSDCLVSDLMQ
jgi:hypothetical protein